MPQMREYQLLICDGCGREKVRPAEQGFVMRCVCGHDTWEIYALTATPLEDERYAVIEEGENHAPIAA